MRSFLIWVVAGLMSVANVVMALDASKPPGANFDLSHWKCTLADATASEVSPARLAAGYVSPFFYTGPDGAMTFWSPVTGGTTANSTYPRSELREMLDPGNSRVNWTGYGTHILRAQCKILKQPSTGKIIIGQVHGFQTDPLVKLQWNDGLLQAYFKNAPGGSDTKHTITTVSPEALINYEIRVTNGVATVLANGRSASHDFFQSSAAWRTNTYYFKAGAYVQDNAGLDDEGGLVAFYELSASHPAAGAPPIKPSITIQPQSRSVAPGGSTTVSASVSGSLPLRFQWRKNKTPISGGTGTSLVVSNFQSVQPVDYDLVVTNMAGAITSSVARLYLDTPARYVTHRRDSAGRVISVFVGKAETEYVLEASTNLVDWTPVKTARSSSGLVSFTNTPTSNRFFFRVGEA